MQPAADVPLGVGPVVVVLGPDPALHARVRGLLSADTPVVVCDVQAITDPDPCTVDALLRLALTARRCGGRIRLLNAPVRLRDVLTCAGLAAILGLEQDSI